MSWLAPAHGAAADPVDNRLKSERIKEEVQQTGDIDLMITNKQLRAESGSKSLWSIGTSLGYSGGSLERPFSEDRPNISGTTATTDKAMLEGELDVKYNVSPQHSVSAGVGLRWIAPLAKNKPRDYDGERVDAANPFLNYQYLYSFAGIQSVLQVQPVVYTESNLVNMGYVSSIGINQDSMMEFEDSRLAAGFSVWAEYGYFNNDDFQDEQADYFFGLSPLLEYEINDVFNIRAVTNLWNFEHLRSESNFSTFRNDIWTQSLGLGISVTRDIFIYPNIQFVPEDIRSDLTNVAVSADINLF